MILTDSKMAITKQLSQLVKKLSKTEQELARVNAKNDELESILGTANILAKVSIVISIKSATKIEFVPINEIIFCSADSGYTVVHMKNNKIITTTKTLVNFEKLLEDYNFFKISKSHIINMDYMVTFFKDKNQILLQGDVLLDVARRRKIDFLKVLE